MVVTLAIIEARGQSGEDFRRRAGSATPSQNRLPASVAPATYRIARRITDHHLLHRSVGRGGGVGRALGIGAPLGVGVGRGVEVGVPVTVGVGEGVAVGVAVAVGVDVGVGVGEDVGVGVGVGPWVPTIRYSTLWSPLYSTT